MDIIIIIVLILLNGIFAMSEIAVISARKSSLMKDSKEGNKGAKTALALADNPDKFLSTIQIGITLIGILTGIYSGDTVAKEVSNLLVKINVPLSYASLIAQVLVVALVTYLTLIFGELVPKRIGMVMPERIAKVVSAPMTILAKIGAPFVWILSNSALLVSRVLGIKDDKSPVTEEEIKSMIEEGRQGGEVKEIEQDIIERAFFLGDRKIESIMTHRNDIVFLDINMSNDEIKKIVSKHSFSAYPVVDKNLDNVIGVVRVTDIFDKLNTSKAKIEKFVKNIDRLFADDYPIKAKINRKSFIEASKRVSAITSEETPGIILEFNNSTLKMSSLETIYGEGSEIIDILDFNAESFEIILNARHVNEILNIIETEDFILEMSDKRSPVLITPSESNYRYLVVPISIDKI